MRKRTGSLFGGFVGAADYATVIPTTGEIDAARRYVAKGGIAGQALKTFPEIKPALGRLIDTCGNHCFVLPVTQQPKAWIVSFPTRHKDAGKPDMRLIKRSAVELVGLADVYGWTKVYLPRVGCGEKGLSWDNTVRPALKDLLDNRFTVIYDEKFHEAKDSKPKNKKPVTTRL